MVSLFQFLIILLLFNITYIIIIYFYPKYNLYSILYRQNTFFEKNQYIRLIDVFILGPSAIWIANRIYIAQNIGKLTTIPKIIPFLMVLYGSMTILYNGYNYIQNILLKRTKIR